MQGSTVTMTCYLDAFGVHVELVMSAKREMLGAAENRYSRRPAQN